jgi:hypothetical protein
MAQGQARHHGLIRHIAAKTGGGVRIVVAGQPEPVPPGLQGRKGTRIGLVQPPRPMPVMEAVAHGDDATGVEGRDRQRHGGQRGARIVGRQENAAPGIGRGLSPDADRTAARSVRLADRWRQYDAGPLQSSRPDSGSASSGDWRLSSCRRFLHHHRLSLGQNRILRFAVNRLAPDFQHHGNPERRDL